MNEHPIGLDDIVRLRVPIAGYPDPLGHVRALPDSATNSYTGEPMSTITGESVVYVERDDGGGTEPFLYRELEYVDLAEFEAEQKLREQLAASNAAPTAQLRPWVCKCERRHAAAVVVCSGCGRTKPWRET